MLLATVAGCAQQIKWYPDLPQGQRVAQAENRPMLLYFWDWLDRDTARLDMQVFPDPRAAAAVRRTVNVRLEAGWFRDVARLYDIQQTPTFILTDPSGAEQGRLIGVPTPRDFADWLESSLRRGADSRPGATSQPEGPLP